MLKREAVASESMFQKGLCPAKDRTTEHPARSVPGQVSLGKKTTTSWNITMRPACEKALRSQNTTYLSPTDSPLVTNTQYPRENLETASVMTSPQFCFSLGTKSLAIFPQKHPHQKPLLGQLRVSP